MFFSCQLTKKIPLLVISLLSISFTVSSLYCLFSCPSPIAGLPPIIGVCLQYVSPYNLILSPIIKYYYNFRVRYFLSNILVLVLLFLNVYIVERKCCMLLSVTLLLSVHTCSIKKKLSHF